MLEKKYEIVQDAPPAISIDNYINCTMKQYKEMLDNPNMGEKAYQHFFERNPAFIPGAFEVIGVSGHDPYLGALISQPRVGHDLMRKPDFLWLSNDSLSFCPVFIEIEDPVKIQFRKDEVPNAKFNQALDQITEWRVLLSKDENRKQFFEDYAIPERLRKMVFEPQYVLVYSRRNEYEKNDFLRDKRCSLQRDNIKIMSFDRLKPSRDVYSFVTVSVSRGKYYVKHIPPTFVYEPLRAENLHQLCGFKEQINKIKMISDERRNFLLERYDYWETFGKREHPGLFNAADKE